MPKKPKVLLIVESCNPDWTSVPLVGYRFYNAAKTNADVTLVTHARNADALKEKHPDDDIIFIEPKSIESTYYSIISRLTTFKGRVIWPLYHMLFYPIYYFFDAAVAKRFSAEVSEGKYDIVHSMTPMIPRYPVKLSKSCQSTPFVLGPVNGGVPFPPGFKNRGRREFSQFNFIRNIGRWVIPNYTRTYQKAHSVLAGSQYTKNWLINTLKTSEENTRLIFENGVPDHFYSRDIEAKISDLGQRQSLRVVFSGRLVPYKGADMLIKAVAKAAEKGIDAHLTIVGDGPEKSSLVALSKTLGIDNRVTFSGWVKQDKIRGYYAQADVFGFPSVREFGGAVVMEAMACGLPYIVVDHGGISEYVDPTCGLKVEPQGEEFVVEEFTKCLVAYAQDRELLIKHTKAAFEKSATFSWAAKAIEIKDVYSKAINTWEKKANNVMTEPDVLPSSRAS